MASQTPDYEHPTRDPTKSSPPRGVGTTVITIPDEKMGKESTCFKAYHKAVLLTAFPQVFYNLSAPASTANASIQITFHFETKVDAARIT